MLQFVAAGLAVAKKACPASDYFFNQAQSVVLSDRRDFGAKSNLWFKPFVRR
jgi:hypothetical protein